MTERKQRRERAGIENCLGKSQFGAQEESGIDQLTIYSQTLCKWLSKHDLIGLPLLSWDSSYKTRKRHPIRGKLTSLQLVVRVSTEHRLFKIPARESWMGWLGKFNARSNWRNHFPGAIPFSYSSKFSNSLIHFYNPSPQPSSPVNNSVLATELAYPLLTLLDILGKPAIPSTTSPDPPPLLHEGHIPCFCFLGPWMLWLI